MVFFYFLRLAAVHSVSLFLQNEMASAGNDICSPAKTQRAEMDSHRVTELGYVFPVHPHVNWEGGNEGP